MFEIFLCILRRDLTLALRRRTDVLTTLLFFVIVVSLFPLGVGSDRRDIMDIRYNPVIATTLRPGRPMTHHRGLSY